MNAIVFKRDSWHGYLAKEWGNLMGADTDICQYTRRVMWGALKMLVAAVILLTIGAAATSFLGDFFGWVIAGLIHGWVSPEVFAGVTAICIALGTIITIIYWTVTGIHVLYSNTHIDTDAFMPAAYRSWKDRVCFRVRIE